ncbi:hypothetical protein PHYPSEUDO_004876 [Phytophthora pseudosyringae]|uniref:LisH domain-containing protein n=1 Tax=Phytophthora pseudosyringae TaxID=221518 RepID=A0A8T1VM46_9STRA|nr:hypothetical protein PHYPSEUDO_004876 [Phytophthora pseudosyringae]
MSAGDATLSDLKDVLKDTLAARGSLDQIKARIRAEIFAALDDQDVPKPKLSNENLIINELIREYFEYNGYRHALSVFLPVTEDPRFTHVPLLYSIIASLQHSRGQEQQRERDLDVEHQFNHQFAAMPAHETHEDRSFDEDPTHQTIVDGAKEPSPVMFKK